MPYESAATVEGCGSHLESMPLENYLWSRGLNNAELHLLESSRESR
jgi:hypothetical protein